ncbi:hypothetical protein R7P79_26170, partial [Vibrio sp. 2128(2023)]|uniref:hypothetical protein n=1 Tax=Vibrio sp. 2128(2023) TaxID=3074714 RepID=UPI002964248F
MFCFDLRNTGKTNKYNRIKEFLKIIFSHLIKHNDSVLVSHFSTVPLSNFVALDQSHIIIVGNHNTT